MRADAVLVRAACSGEPAAVEKLLAGCQPDLRRFARRTCATSEDAEDAVQAALWQLYRKVGALRTAAAFATWLFRIIERECSRLLRRRFRTQRWDETFDQMLHQEPLPHELRSDLASAIAALPEPYRQVLVLRDIDELTAPETAERLSASVEAVKSHLHRARSMMRERLLASGYLGSDA